MLRLLPERFLEEAPIPGERTGEGVIRDPDLIESVPSAVVEEKEGLPLSEDGDLAPWRQEKRQGEDQDQEESLCPTSQDLIEDIVEHGLPAARSQTAQARKPLPGRAARDAGALS